MSLPPLGSSSLSTRLHMQVERETAIVRRLEPVTAGIPLPRGACHDPASITVLDASGVAIPRQTRVLDRWPDGSLRWVLLDLQLNYPGSYVMDVARESSAAEVQGRLEITRHGGTLLISTGAINFAVGQGALVKAMSSRSDDPDALRAELQLTNAAGRPVSISCGQGEIECEGPLRATVRLAGSAEVDPGAHLKVIARLHFFARSAVVRVELTIRNERPATHAGGFWELGDPGSVYFRDFSLHVRAPAQSSVVHCQLGEDAPRALRAPVELYQDSSGGENWRSANHMNREGRIPLRFRGYRLRSGDSEQRGDRATPSVWLDDSAHSPVAGTMRHFWQNFPKAIEADEHGLTLRLFPQQSDDLHELQGGEQKTHVVGIAFDPDRVGRHPLEWILNPALLCAGPEWYARCEAVPYLTPAAHDPHADYLALVNSAIEGPDRFELKREIVDEYGWRNFGDIYADHEAVRETASQPLVSHYNNQYDAIAGFAIQFMRSRDFRWWVALQELAAHVADIDIYHTQQDKSAYNGGLLWHTLHYVDAGKATHRAYPRTAGVSGGGPSDEHNYATGLMLHYFLTGNETSRDAVLSLADWVCAMDDGRRTPFRWLTAADTGLASSTASTTFHGPGRGAANSITTLLNAYRLTGQRRYLNKAEALITRCIHPADDLATMDLLNAERRWSYTVFLQALGRYLDETIMRGELGWHYAYARSSLLHYARWMAQHEYPYLEKPEILEFPNETWAAQDMRKSDIFNYAARHAVDPERSRFLERANWFFRVSIDSLNRYPTRTLARPVVLMLSYGYIHAASVRGNGLPEAPAALGSFEYGTPGSFVPQKTIAKRRAMIVAGAALLSALGCAALLSRLLGWA